MEKYIVDLLIRYRYVWSLLCLLLIVTFGYGAKDLYFDSDYRVFFDDDDPQRVAHEAMQTAYTKTDNLVYLIKPAKGDVFTQETLGVIKAITDESWQAPFSIRVDSLTNFQYSRANGDDLVVSDLVPQTGTLTQADLDRIRQIALNEKQLVHRIIAKDGRTTLINISLELPEINLAADEQTQAEQRAARETSFEDVTNYGNDIRARVMAEYPGMEVHLLGIPVINNSFNTQSKKDSAGLIPLMYGIIAVILGLLFWSFFSVFGALVVIGTATVSAMGFAGWMGIPLTNITVVAPIIILTIAVCDSVHLLIIYLRNLGHGHSPVEAMRESLLINLTPIALTSITTAVGFSTLNFSDSPIFRQLGNISALGVMLAMIYTLCLLPAIQILLVRRRSQQQSHELATRRFADFVIAHRKPVFAGTMLAAAALISLIPLNQIDDDPIKYFKKSVPYRQAAGFSQKNLPGIKNVDFSISCGRTDCVNNPEFLNQLREFSGWAEAQPGVEYVSTYIDVIKRLNKNMHGDDPDYYRVPQNRELAAQYQLLYELSLPYGLDLNNQINFDKSATRVSVWMRQVSTSQFVGFEHKAEDWFEQNYPELRTRGSSVHMMFAALGERNIRSMSVGALFALVGVTLTILIAMRSFKYGLLSMVPNAFPAAMSLGIWGLVIGQVNMAVTVVFSITLGLVVDNTVHFISKYRRSLDSGNSTQEAIRYAFSTVGMALLITTTVLTIGFALLSLSDFNVNAYLGGLTAITIVVALVFDFLMLPALLLMVDKKHTEAHG